MKRIVFLALLFIFATGLAGFAEEKFELRDYDGIEIPKGTFIPVINSQEISTAYCDVGATVRFVAADNLYLYETNIIPKNTEFFGIIEKINEPVVGTNGSLVIFINKLRYADGFEIPIKAYIYTSNGNVIGGELTAPSVYDKVAHYQQGLGTGTLQYVPGATRRMGDHTVVTSGADMMVILVQPVFITHTLTD